MAESARSTVQSVTRAFEILEIMSSGSDDMGISHIAEQSSLPLPTIHRILRTLVVNGYVYQTPGRRYALGARLIPLSRNAGGALGASLRPRLAAIAKQTHESVSVAMLDREFARYIAHVPSDQSMRMFAQVGNQIDLHATGVGKAMMSLLPDAEIRDLLHRTGMHAVTSETITNIETMMVEIEHVRRRGYAMDVEEHELGVNCVAVPIHGPLLLAMSVSGPQPRMTRKTIEQLVPILVAAADEISAELRHVES
jgi:IclR family acetate operon transcriptional repressor